MKNNNTNHLFPSIINLELTNACNLECAFCDHPILKRTMAVHDIEDNLLEKVLTDISSHEFFELGLVGLGEPLLDRNFKVHLDIISGFINNFTRISINTNGVALTEEKAKLICKSPINHITFSLNATNRQDYHQMMKRDCFHKVIENIKRFMRQRQKSHRNDLSANVQAMEADQNAILELEKELGEEAKNLFIFSRKVYRKPVLADNNYVSVPNVDEKRFPCWSIFSRVYVDVNGNLYPCTIGNDSYRDGSELLIGNVFQKNIIDLFNDPKLAEARMRACRSSLPFTECSDCNVWGLLPNNFVWSKEENAWEHNGNELRLKNMNGRNKN